MKQRIPEVPPRPLNTEELAAFDRDGVVCVRGLYSPRWVKHLTETLEAICAGSSPFGGKPTQKFRSEPFSWMLNDAVRDFVLEAPTAHIVQQAFNSTAINFFYDQIFVKRQMTPEATPWHHDFTFWPIAGHQIASVWTSVDATDAESSALEFIAGSHRWPQRFKAIGVGGIVLSTEAHDLLPDIDAERDKHDILSWAMEPGDALLFHALTVHGSQGNRSPDRQRRAITTRWCGDDVVFRPQGRQMPIPWSHGLKDGDALDCGLFPRVLPEIDMGVLSRRMKGPIKPETLKMLQVGLRMARAERVAV